MDTLLDAIKEENDIKKIEEKEYPRLAKEIRQFLLEHISKSGGHLASNLGVVELLWRFTQYFVSHRIN